MDGDDFSRATRLGRAAADAIMSAATTGAFDGFATAQLIARFVESSGGIPSLPAVLSVLGDLTAPIVRAAADELLRRPDAKRLLLARAFRIDEDSNLLGAA